MLALLLLLAAGPETAIEAERAFNAAAQSEGQWTAFRKYAADDAIVFTPQPESVKTALPAKDPPIAVQWWPADSFVSCDGKLAVNTGPWVRPGSFGYFTTVWRLEADGHWKWIVDAGDETRKPRQLPEKPRVRRASCRNKPASNAFEDAIPVGPKQTVDGTGSSPDNTLLWEWHVMKDGRRTFMAHVWTGAEWEPVILDDTTVPQ